MANYYDKKKALKNLVTAIAIVNLSGVHTILNTARAADSAATTIVAPADSDILKLLDSLKNYNQTPDLALVSGITSSFYNSDSEIDKALQKKANEAIAALDKSGDATQTDANKAMIGSLMDANVALKAKLVLQKAASKAFDEAGKSATSLNKIEKAQEAQCLKGFNNALQAGSSVADDCNNLKEEDDRKNCGAELDACASKISADLGIFTNAYLAKRNKLQPSKVGFKEVSAEADNLEANIPASAQVCNQYTVKMVNLEFGSNCLQKLKDDEVNEAYQGEAVDTKALGIHAELDSNMLTPEHRIAGWAKLKQMADIKIKETEAAIIKVQEYLKKVGVIDIGGEEGTTFNDDETIGLRTNSGTTVSVGVIKRFFATNPSPEIIMQEAAKLGLTKAEIAHAMNLAGYGGEKPSDLNNFAQTKALEAKYMTKIDEFVSSKGGNFNGPSGSLQVAGTAPVDATKNVMSNQGWVTPDIVKNFLATNPTDQQFFAKMSELGLRTSDITSILNGQGMLFKDGDPRQILLNDKDFGSIFNRLQNELFQGTTGYGVADPYDPNSLIVKGTGHIYDEENKTWIPFGFKNIPNQHVTSNTLATQPPVSVGGQFGVGQGAIKNARAVKKVIKASDLKKLTTK